MNLLLGSRRVFLSAALLTIFVLVGAACGADDPIETVGGVEMCQLESASGEPLTDGSGAEGAGEAPHDEAPMGDSGDMHDEEGTEEHDAAAEDLNVEWIIDIEMNEFSYSCDLPTLEVGTVVALRFANTGLAEHEAVVGDLRAQDDAEAEMSGGAPMGDDHGHATPSITLAPGESGVLQVVLDQVGSLIIGCHIAGHWDAGMRSNFDVA